VAAQPDDALDARRRLLKPQARLVPHTLTLLVRPLLIPDAEARQRAIEAMDKLCSRWRG
jgi:hypothetical protein